jgi:hypothetical protein
MSECYRTEPVSTSTTFMWNFRNHKGCSARFDLMPNIVMHWCCSGLQTCNVLFRIGFIMPFGRWLFGTALVVHIAVSSDQSFWSITIYRLLVPVSWVFCFPHANEVCKDMLLSFFIFLPVLLSSHTRFTVQVNGSSGKISNIWTYWRSRDSCLKDMIFFLFTARYEFLCLDFWSSSQGAYIWLPAPLYTEKSLRKWWLRFGPHYQAGEFAAISRHHT